MKTGPAFIVLILAVAALASASAYADPRDESSRYVVYGVVDAIDVMREGGEGIGAGTVIGGVVGGVLGNQVGRGRGRDAATVAGVVGGAVVGHQLEKRDRQQEAYRIRVRLEDGEYRTVTQQSVGDLQVGDRVRIEDGHVSRD